MFLPTTYFLYQYNIICYELHASIHKMMFSKEVEINAKYAAIKFQIFADKVSGGRVELVGRVQ